MCKYDMQRAQPVNLTVGKARWFERYSRGEHLMLLVACVWHLFSYPVVFCLFSAVRSNVAHENGYLWRGALSTPLDSRQWVSMVSLKRGECIINKDSFTVLYYSLLSVPFSHWTLRYIYMLVQVGHRKGWKQWIWSLSQSEASVVIDAF